MPVLKISLLRFWMVLLLGLNLCELGFLAIITQLRNESQLLSKEEFNKVVEVVRTQPAEKGRQNALEILQNSDKAMRSLGDFEKQIFPWTTSFLIGNIVGLTMCVHGVRKLRAPRAPA